VRKNFGATKFFAFPVLASNPIGFAIFGLRNLKNRAIPGKLNRKHASILRRWHRCRANGAHVPQGSVCSKLQII